MLRDKRDGNAVSRAVADVRQRRTFDASSMTIIVRLGDGVQRCFTLDTFAEAFDRLQNCDPSALDEVDLRACLLLGVDVRALTSGGPGEESLQAGYQGWLHECLAPQGCQNGINDVHSK